MTIISNKLKEIENSKHNRENWNISWTLCSFLSNIVKLNNPKNILEIGTSTGFSTLCILKYLNKNSNITTIEINKERFEIAKSNFNFIQKQNICQINQDVFIFLNSINLDKSNKFDFIFIDAVQSKYLDLIKLIIEKELTSKNCIIIFDNISSHKNMDLFVDFMEKNFKFELLNIDSGFLIAYEKINII